MSKENNNVFVIKYNDLVFEKLIDTGSFAQVWIGSYNNVRVAIKIIKDDSDNLLIYIEREMDIVSTLNHNNVLAVYGLVIEEGHPLCIVTEYIESGSLKKCLAPKSHIKLSWHDKRQIAIQTAAGMADLHQKGILHRDLKSSNLLYDIKTKTIKICDFGLATYEDGHQCSAIGTPAWMAPEIAVKGRYTEKIDVFSYGMVLWELLTETTPRDRIRDVGNMARLMEWTPTQTWLQCIPNDAPKELVDLFLKCVNSSDPDKRPNFHRILYILNNTIDNNINNNNNNNNNKINNNNNNNKHDNNKNNKNKNKNNNKNKNKKNKKKNKKNKKKKEKKEKESEEEEEEEEETPKKTKKKKKKAEKEESSEEDTPKNKGKKRKSVEDGDEETKTKKKKKKAAKE